MGVGADPQAVFQLFDSTLPATTPEVLGLWIMAPIAATESVAFDTNAGTLAAAPLWQANLPADMQLAEAHLASAEAQLRACQQALPVAADRLQSFADTQRAGMAFDISPGGRVLPRPEAELLVLLSAMHAGRPPVSFGLGERLMGGWEQAMQPFQAMLERLRQFIAAYAWVETHVQDVLVGRTTMSWTGDVDTIWQAGLGPEQVMLHQRTLALALQSRATLLRTFVQATQLAVKLSVLLSTPGGVILALPAAWKFINQVLAEISQQP